jgi:hypothetical protein
MKDYKKLDANEKRAFVRELIREGVLTGIKASETRFMKEAECVDLIESALKEKGASGSGAIDMKEIDDRITASLEGVLKKLVNIDADYKNVKSFIDSLLKKPSAMKSLPAKTAAAGGNKIVNEIIRFYEPSKDNETKLLLLSPPSFGKSYAVRLCSKAYDHFIEHGCSPAIDEIDTLLGSPTPDGKGGFEIVDGKLAEAVRKAGNGETVLFFFDEALRLSEAVQAWLLTFLTGVKTADGLQYQLTTRKPEGGALEVIKCAAKNLHFICGANLTATKPVSAFWSRFRKKRIAFDLETAESIAASILSGFEVSEDKNARRFASNFALAMSLSRALIKEGAAAEALDFRCLEDALRGAEKCETRTDLQSVIRDLQAIVLDHCPLWDLDLGETDKESAEAHVDVINQLEKGII